MKKLFLFSFAILLPVIDADASTIGWGAKINQTLGLEDASPALQGSLVRLGYFTVPDLQLQTWAAAGDKLSLDAAFAPFVDPSVDPVYVGANLNLDGVWDVSSVNVNPSFVGKDIYYYTLDAATLAAATQWGVFKLPTLFPSDNPTPASINTDLNQVPTNVTGLIVGTHSGSVYKMASISPVPEPSTFTGGVLLALAAMGVRRRRRA